MTKLNLSLEDELLQLIEQGISANDFKLILKELVLGHRHLHPQEIDDLIMQLRSKEQDTSFTKQQRVLLGYLENFFNGLSDMLSDHTHNADNHALILAETVVKQSILKNLPNEL